uniref:Ribosomal protein L6 n=1 Tax=Babesia sp. Dunhuang TaxID=1164853 RepID=A0A411AD47_9APIC|nr:ribosomal protein L6 [Babesia sp. Dunhuang]
MKYLKNYYNYINFKTLKHLYIIDKYTRHVYLSLFSLSIYDLRVTLILNKFIFKTIFNKPIFFYNNKIKFIVFVKSFISKIYNMIESLSTLYTINIQILNIFYKVVFVQNKLIIKINNFVNIVLYISNIEKLKLNIQYSTPILISISSYNKNLLNTLGSIIINSAKFNVYTNTGIKYLDKNIKFKKILKLRKK